MMIKYYNIAMNKKERENEKHFDAWDIFRKIEKENFEDLSLIDLFNKSLKNVLDKMYQKLSAKIFEIWKWYYKFKH